MSPQCRSDIIDVSESDARLAYDKRIRWWRDHPICNVGLEVVDGCTYEEDIIAPSCYNWIWPYSGVTVFFEEG